MQRDDEAIGLFKKAAGTRAPMRRVARGTSLAGWGLAGPAALLLIIMLPGPSLAVVILSFSDWTFGAQDPSFVGLRNYEELVTHRTVGRSIRNTFAYVLFVAPASVFLALVIATAIEAQTRGRALFRTAYFLPVTGTLVAMSIVWEYLFHPTLGPINQIIA